MSFYLRSIPHKFTSLINTHRQIVKFDHYLNDVTSSKHVKSSLFLDEFLGMQTTTNTAINSTEKSLNSLLFLVEKNIPVTLFNTYLEKPNNFNKQQIVTLHQQNEINIQALNTTNCDLKHISILVNDTQQMESLMIPENKKSGLSEIRLTKRIFDSTLPSFERKSILYSEVLPDMQNVNEEQSKHHKPHKQDSLEYVYNCLREELPKMFTNAINYNLYTEDIIFVNNIREKTTVGIFPYMKQIILLKIIGHLSYAYIKLNILKMTMHPEDNSIKVRWRIEGVSGTKVLLSFWKYKIWKNIDHSDKKSTWYDGFSTFYVNNNGKIYKHVVDKMMPDEGIHEKTKTAVETKLALFTALLNLDSYYIVKFDLEICPQLLEIK